VSVPFARTEEDLPVGVQLVASAGEEPLLLRLSAEIEAARPWLERRPAGVS
jgi:Asp-tRNA(Asn)/Glu-tRNA(Gln) amidotransferase A subunit family amidase